MPVTAMRNGSGARPFPRTPLLLAPVPLPFKGDYAGIIVNFDVAAVRALLDDDAAGLHALSADLETDEQALDADPALTDEERDARHVAIWQEQAWRVLARAVHSVEWGFTDPPPDPRTPATWDGWDPQIVVWIAQIGLVRAGTEWAGPFLDRMRRSAFFAITASLPGRPNAS